MTICLFVCLFVYLLTGLHKYYLLELHEKMQSVQFIGISENLAPEYALQV